MNVISLPLPADAGMTDAELASHLAGAAGKLLAELTEAEDDRDCYRSSWVSLSRRLEAMQLRRLRYLLIGLASGAVPAVALTLIIDGTLARWLAS